MGEVRGYGSILTAAALFGASATVGWRLMNELAVPPLTALIAAHGIASLVFLPRARKVRLRRKDARLLLFWGLNGAGIAPYLWFAGVPLTTATEAALLANLEALFTVVFAYAFLRERVPRRGYAGIASLLVGAIAVTTDFDFVTFRFAEHLLGNAMLILSALCFGIDNNMSRVIIRTYDRRGVAFYKLWIGLVALVPIAIALALPWPTSPAAIPLVLFLGLGGVAGVIWFFYIAFEEIGAMRTGALISTSALFGVAVAFAAFGQPPTVAQFGGGLLMLAGTFLTTEWTPRFRRNRQGTG